MLVSVIIPAKNAERTIGSLLESLLAQRYRPLEIITIEGGSNDGTRWIIEEHILKAINAGIILRLLDEDRFPGPLGPAHARNIGIAESEGKYILFLDADYMLLNETDIEEIVKELKRHPAVSVRVRPLIDSWIEEQVALDDYRQEYKANVHYYFAIHKELLKSISFNENIGFGEDFDLFSRCGMKPVLIDVIIGRHFPSSLKEYIDQARWYGQTSLPFMKKDVSNLKLMLKTLSGYIFPLVLLLMFTMTLATGWTKISIVFLCLYVIFVIRELMLSPKRTPSRLLYLTLIKPPFRLLFFILGVLEYLRARRFLNLS